MEVGVLIRVTGIVLAVAWAAACGSTETYPGRGVVQEVSASEQQILIDHEDIPGLMPAMTMNLAVYDRELLASLSPGDVIEFELTKQRGSFFITAATVVGQVEAEDGWSRLGDTLVKSDPAPPFELTDTEGEAVSLGGLAGRIVLLDFIFTRCPGPCPALTSNHVTVQRGLPDSLRDDVHFVSITIDPERDTAEDLRRYGEARGADLSGWSFLDGDPEAVRAVMSAYGIGTKPIEQDDVEHVLATFLIDREGRMVKRYLGVGEDPAVILADRAAAAG